MGLAQSLKEEGAKYNIKINTIAPIAKSRMTENLLPPDILSLIDPGKISPIVAYLSSSECAVSGQCWSIGAGTVSRIVISENEGLSIMG